jgi:cytochrome c oxidase cbb3-type subunit 3/ubiquinol-cytochrome c reductase cytochrome c subunit
LAAAGLLAALTLSPSCKRSNAPNLAQGKKDYDRACALCHGPQGEGYKADNAPAIGHAAFLSAAPDAFLLRAIERGRPGTAMGAYGTSHGGPFDTQAIQNIVHYIRSWKGVRHAPAEPRAARGDGNSALAPYEAECKKCHGDRSARGEYIHLAHPDLLASADDSFLRSTIEGGRDGTPMPSFRDKLNAETIDGIVTLLRSWQRPTADAPKELPSKTLDAPLLNPKGPEPAWNVPAAEFTPVAVVKVEYDRGARFALLDVRPPSNYVEGHIAGSVSVPYYEAAKYAEQLPKDAWIVTYCGCPHAESGQAAKALREKGFTKVTVLDEGIREWSARGYPLSYGPRP